VLAREVYDWRRIGRAATEVVRQVGQTRS
jgi:hypothetical protein